jgi:hypothetical protein
LIGEAEAAINAGDIALIERSATALKEATLNMQNNAASQASRQAQPGQAQAHGADSENTVNAEFKDVTH